ncbi:formate dehydrogenase accessory sulfurtransferase FdhD [Siminovitchia sp. 179-K 8D1 HS]|uniref:formate dehydrogenase accessory sulfurtransferase FdhD n=1 Tax=Siminovitchia sp. 179-K 8D1 HS TaxID=3142385 RepID=UPI0039A0CF9D
MSRIVQNNLKIWKYDGQAVLETEDCAAVEFPLTIYIDGEEFATAVCSPTDLEQLTVGFLASEGIIRQIDDLASLIMDHDRGFAYAELKRKQTISKEFYSKRMIGSCCGKSRQFYFYNDAKTAKTVMSKQKISVDQCFHLMKQLQMRSEDFQLTGGVHNAALCTTGEVLASFSDIGRHNALDKIYGHCLMNQVPLQDKAIAFSGRISSEVVLKAAKIGVGILISKSAPTTLGISLAEDLGITAIGFARKTQLNIYSHPERIIEASGPKGDAVKM